MTDESDPQATNPLTNIPNENPSSWALTTWSYDFFIILRSLKAIAGVAFDWNLQGLKKIGSKLPYFILNEKVRGRFRFQISPQIKNNIYSK